MDDMIEKIGNVDMIGCAKHCLSDDNCTDGWIYNHGSKKVKFINILTFMSIHLKEHFLFQCYFTTSLGNVTYSDNWSMGQSACGVYEYDQNNLRSCIDF